MKSATKNLIQGVGLGTLIGVALRLDGYLMTRGARADSRWVMFMVMPLERWGVTSEHDFVFSNLQRWTPTP